jgi:hypothetical protein
MVNLDSIKNLDSISVSDINLHSVINDSDTSMIGTETYKNIINQAKKLNVENAIIQMLTKKKKSLLK